MKRKRKKVSAVILLTLFLFLENLLGNMVCFAAGNAEDAVGELHALSAVLMDAESGRVLLGKEEDIARPMASTTKILTCILALEEGWQDDIVLVSKNAQKQPKVHAGIQENEQYWLLDLLYSLMLESHNDSAVAIAEHIAGSVEDFADMMNQKAKEIGCTSAHFVTPNGLDGADDEGMHCISAVDLARIMRYCIKESPKKEAFLQITQTQSYSFREVTGKRTISCSNHNQFFHIMDGVISGKTGFTGEAGYCYVGAVENDGRTFIIALLGSGWPNNKNYKWIDSKKLILYGKETYFYEKPSKKIINDTITVKNGVPLKGLFNEAVVKVQIELDEEYGEILKSGKEEVQVIETIDPCIQAPIKAGQKVGEICYYIENEMVMKRDMIAKHNVNKKTFAWVLENVVELYIGNTKR